MDNAQKANVAFSVAVLLWLAGHQAGLVSRKEPDPKTQEHVRASNLAAADYPKEWSTTERAVSAFRADLVSKSEMMLASTSEVKTFLDRKARERALLSVAPFDAKLRSLEDSAAISLAPEVPQGGAVVVGSSMRGRSYPSSSSSSSSRSSFSHK